LAAIAFSKVMLPYPRGQLGGTMTPSKAGRSFWIISRRKRLDYSAVWSRFYYAYVTPGAEVSFRSDGPNISAIDASKIEEVLDDVHIQSFTVEGEGFSVSYVQNGRQNFDSMFVDSSSSALSPDMCDELLVETIAEDPNFLQAHLVDAKFQNLQNMFDPLQFEAHGISIDGLPMKSNSLPYPLEQEIVDTSGNPGRFELHEGYVEVSAGHMWFGTDFWPRVGKKPFDVIAELPVGAFLVFDKCWKLTFATSVFSSLKTRESQEEIRRAIFT